MNRQSVHCTVVPHKLALSLPNHAYHIWNCLSVLGDMPEPVGASYHLGCYCLYTYFPYIILMFLYFSDISSEINF